MTYFHSYYYDPDGPNDIDVSRMVPNGLPNDFTIGGFPPLGEISYKFNDTFSYNVKRKAMKVPLMTINKVDW